MATLSIDRPAGEFLLLQRLEVEDHVQHRAEQRIGTVGIGAIGATPVVAILIAPLESFAEVVVVVVLPHVAAVEAVVGVLIGEGSPVVEAPVVLLVRAPCLVTFLVPGVRGLPEPVGAVLIGLVVGVAPAVLVGRRRVVERVVIVVVAVIREARLLLAQLLVVRLLVAVMGLS